MKVCRFKVNTEKEMMGLRVEGFKS